MVAQANSPIDATVASSSRACWSAARRARWEYVPRLRWTTWTSAPPDGVGGHRDSSWSTTTPTVPHGGKHVAPGGAAGP